MPHSILKSGSRLTILTFISRILGLVREMTRASFLGTSPLSDAFGVAFLIPNLLRRLFAENSISVAFIPTFRQYLERQDMAETRKFLSATLTLVSFLTTLCVLAGIASAPLIVPLFGTVSDETVLLTRIMFPYLAVISVAAFFQGILNGVRLFSPSGFTPILFNLAVIGTTHLLGDRLGNPARAMAAGVLLGGTIQALFQLPFVLRQGFRFPPASLRSAFTNHGTRTVLRLIGPTTFGMAAYQLNDLVSTALASNAGTGVVSSLQFSLRLQELMLGVFAVSIGTVILPDLATRATKADWEPFNQLMMTAMRTIALITIPVTFFSLVCGESIITLLFKSNSFTSESVRLTLAAFTWHIIGLFFIALNRVISPAFYAMQDTKSPTTAGIWSFAVNIGFTLILVRPMAGGGIALALSLASVANSILLFVFMRNKKGFQPLRLAVGLGSYASKMILLSLVSVTPIYLLRPLLWKLFSGHGRIIGHGVPLIISMIIFAGIGLGLLWITRDPILYQLRTRISGRKPVSSSVAEEQDLGL